MSGGYVRVCGTLAVVCCCTLVAQAAVTIDLVAVGNPGNAGEGAGNSYGGLGPNRICGAVDYFYSIGKYEVTNAQWREFLTVKASTSDPYGLYNTSMGETNGGITRMWNVDHYEYTAKGGDSNWDNRPVNFVSFWDAARFCNWLHNGQGNGDTETGAYTLNGYNGSDGRTIMSNPGAKWFLPSEDEWYKAAYYDPNKGGAGVAGYYDYPTKSDTPPTNTLLSPDPGNHANYNPGAGYTIGAPYYTTEVGDFENSGSAYGTFDQGGNIWEWNETIVDEWESSAARGLRGGGWSYIGGSIDLAASDRTIYSEPMLENSLIGFRVANVPEPAGITMLLILCGLVSLLVWRKPMRFRIVFSKAVLSLMLVTALASVVSADQIPIFIVAGQSNAVGYATNTNDISSSLLTAQSNVLYAGSQLSAVNWVSLQAPTETDTSRVASGSGFGPELMVGKTISDALGGQEVGIVKFAINGSSLCVDWNPNTPGSYYYQMLDRVNSALAQLPNQQPGTTGYVAGFFWMQGESDSVHYQRTTAQYQADLTEFIGDLRTAVGDDDLPFVFGLINNAGAGTATVRQAQFNVAATVAHTYLVDTDSYERVTPTDIHFNSQGTVSLGTGFGEGYLALTTPEPGSLMLMLCGVAALLVRRRLVRR